MIFCLQRLNVVNVKHPTTTFSILTRLSITLLRVRVYPYKAEHNTYMQSLLRVRVYLRTLTLSLTINHSTFSEKVLVLLDIVVTHMLTPRKHWARAQSFISDVKQHAAYKSSCFDQIRQQIHPNKFTDINLSFISLYIYSLYIPYTLGGILLRQFERHHGPAGILSG